MASMYKFMRDIWKHPEKYGLDGYWKQRLIKWRREPTIVRVKKPGKTKVTVSANGRTLGSAEFRVKTLPDPITTIGAKGTSYYKGGLCPKSTLLALSGINATMENFDFELRYRITNFTVTCNIGGFDESARSSSRKFTPQQKNIIRKAKSRSRVIIEGVKCVGPDGRSRKINDLVLKLR